MSAVWSATARQTRLRLSAGVGPGAYGGKRVPGDYRVAWRRIRRHPGNREYRRSVRGASAALAGVQISPYRRFALESFTLGYCCDGAEANWKVARKLNSFDGLLIWAAKADASKL